jgi:micrococcal nuclease
VGPDVQERDRYRRVRVYLYLEDPWGDWTYGGRRFLQVNLELVRAGWAEPYTVPSNVRYAELYVQAARGWGLESCRLELRPRLPHGSPWF